MTAAGSVPACSSDAPITSASDRSTTTARTGGTSPSTGAPDVAPDAIRVTLTEVASFDTPTSLTARPGHPDQLFVTERVGRVRLVTLAHDGTLDVHPTPLVDFSDEISTDGEQGLSGLAFSPDGNRVYLSSNELDGDTRIDAAPVTGTDSPAIGKRTTILTVDQPDTTNHKGGNLATGPDGLVYLGLGDGGGQGDPLETAQDLDVLLGKMIRLDPERIDRSGRVTPEIFARGLRNPWRFSFDAATGDLWIADVGQNEREEVNVVPAGTEPVVNFGWSHYEATAVYEEGRDAPEATPPIFEELHEDGSCSITGGFVYRGAAIPDLVGTYVYSDLCRGGLRALQRLDDGSVRSGDLSGTDDAAQVISFGVDGRGELYALSLTGTVWRIDPA